MPAKRVTALALRRAVATAKSLPTNKRGQNYSAKRKAVLCPHPERPQDGRHRTHQPRKERLMSEVWGATRLLFSRREVSKLLGISERQITRQIANGRLRIVRIGARTLVHRDEVQRFAANGLPFMNPRD
jgi:excisionase family DNA binding protein